MRATSTAPRSCCRRRSRATGRRVTCGALPSARTGWRGVSLRAGRAREARDLQSGMLDYVVSCGDPEFLATTLETAACITAELGEGLRAARLAGAAEAIRHKSGTPIPQPEAALLERFLAPARAATAHQAWDAELAAGRALTQQQAATLLVSPIPST
jgi:hypothetical protein